MISIITTKSILNFKLKAGAKKEHPWNAPGTGFVISINLYIESALLSSSSSASSNAMQHNPMDPVAHWVATPMAARGTGWALLE